MLYRVGQHSFKWKFVRDKSARVHNGGYNVSNVGSCIGFPSSEKANSKVKAFIITII